MTEPQWAAAARANRTHGMTKTKTHRAWVAMRSRCGDANHRQFADYGGRGITVCERWLSFENFLADMGVAPEGEQLDRINNDGNYEPGNCRWATPQQNSANRRSSRLITHGGVTKCLSEWARDAGIARCSLANRLRAGWPIDRALTEPRTK